MLIVLSGKKGSGKDTIADMFVKKGWIKVAFAQFIKKALIELMGWDESVLNNQEKEKNDKYWDISPRFMMQYLGTEVLRNSLGDKLCKNISYQGKEYQASFHIKRLHQLIVPLLEDNKNVIIVDGRFQDEIDYVKWMGGLTIGIRGRENLNEYSNHSSEKDINHFQNIDLVINNSGTLESLTNKVNHFIEFGTLPDPLVHPYY